MIEFAHYLEEGKQRSETLKRKDISFSNDVISLFFFSHLVHWVIANQQYS